MNSNMQLEQWLRSWKPHGPSPALKWQLFSHPPAKLPADTSVTRQPMARPHKTSAGHHIASWLAAATACAIIVTGLSRTTSSDTFFWNPAGHARSLATAALSNQFYAAYIPGSHSLWNPSLPIKVRWTNNHAPPPTKSFGTHSKTNLLRQ